MIHLRSLAIGPGAFIGQAARVLGMIVVLFSRTIALGGQLTRAHRLLGLGTGKRGIMPGERSSRMVSFLLQLAELVVDVVGVAQATAARGAGAFGTRSVFLAGVVAFMADLGRCLGLAWVAEPRVHVGRGGAR